MKRENITNRTFNEAYKKVMISHSLKRDQVHEIFKLSPTGREYSKTEIQGFGKSDEDKNFVPMFYLTFLDFLGALVLYMRG